MNRVRVGAVTIGQSPRDDVVPELSRKLGPSVEVLQRGALDRLTLDRVREHEPASGEETLVSRMKDATEVTLAKDFVVPRLQEAIRSLEQDEVMVVLLLCTAPFDDLECHVPLLRPAHLLEQEVSALHVNRLGVFTPSAAQIDAQRGRWRGLARQVLVEAVSPYSDAADFGGAAERLADMAVDAVVMDCIGYSNAMLEVVRSIMRVPVLSAQEVLGKVAVEHTKPRSSDRGRGQ